MYASFMLLWGGVAHYPYLRGDFGEDAGHESWSWLWNLILDTTTGGTNSSNSNPRRVLLSNGISMDVPNYSSYNGGESVSDY